jgi:hypothetical protein
MQTPVGSKKREKMETLSVKIGEFVFMGLMAAATILTVTVFSPFLAIAYVYDLLNDRSK